MRKMTKLGIDELKEILPVLDDETQRSVYGGCGSYGDGSSGNDCLYQVLANFTGRNSSDMQTAYANYLINNLGYQVSAAYEIAAKGVRSSDATAFITKFGFNEGYSTSGDGTMSCRENGILITQNNGSGHAYKIIGRTAGMIYCVDIQGGKEASFLENDKSIYNMYTHTGN